MTTSRNQSLKIQLEEAVQMLRLVANQERTCVEVAEWLEQNYPEETENNDKSIVKLLLKSGYNHEES